MQTYKLGLFHDWVPKPVQLLLIILLTIPILGISGVYSTNIGDMLGSQGMLTEDLMMASYASAIGMALVFPLALRTKQFFRSRHLLIGSLSSLILLSYVCATTDHAWVLIGANTVMGMIKAFAMMEVILPIMFIISPSGDRPKFYSVFYPLSIALAQVASYFATKLSFEYSWHAVYYYTIAILLCCLLLVLIFGHNFRGSKKVPFYQVDWLSFVLILSAMMLLNYVLSYGRILDWWNNQSIKYALFGSVLLTTWFIQRQMLLKRPFLSLEVFKRKSVWMSLVFIFLMGIFFASSGIQSAFTTGVLKYSALSNAEINLMMALGAIAGGFFCFIWFKREWSLKGLVLCGFTAFILYHLILFFLFSPVIEINDLAFPLFLKGLGLTILYISIGVYCADKLSLTELLAAVSILILFRSFIGPAFWSSVYAYELYAGQLKHTAFLVQHMDANDPLLTGRLSPLVQGAMSQGRSVEAAQSLAVSSVWGTVQLQATMAAAKEIFGWIVIGGGLVLLFVMSYRFVPVNFRRLVNIRRRFRGQEMLKRQEEMLGAIAP
ncbi:hypothetical protein H9X96_10515 [Pedobacter sp. N36a]|uniref:hypothetical protein n=1 Tax=Pedobacter sp. N36a TaxID=2767996 RepID=UPI001656FA66|nr:hypothetical protein [Pedobacter sp. N36a]MBC8986206.1 hypothetical protein [Pedobacter sp. N36a]